MYPFMFSLGKFFPLISPPTPQDPATNTSADDPQPFASNEINVNIESDAAVEGRQVSEVREVIDACLLLGGGGGYFSAVCASMAS